MQSLEELTLEARLARMQDNNKARKMAQGIRIAIENNATAFCARRCGYSAMAETEAEREKAFKQGKTFLTAVRRGKKIDPAMTHTALQVEPFAAMVNEAESRETDFAMLMVEDMRHLPILDWIKNTKGLGGEKGFGIAMLLGIVGDMRRFRDGKGLPGLYKYLRLSVTDKGVSDRIGSKQYRSCVWMIGFQLQNHNPEYKALYVKRKEYELTKLDKVREVIAQECAARKVKMTPKKLDSAAAARCTKMAKRWLDKKFIERLYYEWLRCTATPEWFSIKEKAKKVSKAKGCKKVAA